MANEPPRASLGPPFGAISSADSGPPAPLASASAQLSDDGRLNTSTAPWPVLVAVCSGGPPVTPGAPATTVVPDTPTVWPRPSPAAPGSVPLGQVSEDAHSFNSAVSVSFAQPPAGSLNT